MPPVRSLPVLAGISVFQSALTAGVPIWLIVRAFYIDKSREDVRP